MLMLVPLHFYEFEIDPFRYPPRSLAKLLADSNCKALSLNSVFSQSTMNVVQENDESS